MEKIVKTRTGIAPSNHEIFLSLCTYCQEYVSFLEEGGGGVLSRKCPLREGPLYVTYVCCLQHKEDSMMVKIKDAEYSQCIAEMRQRIAELEIEVWQTVDFIGELRPLDLGLILYQRYLIL